MSIGEAALTNLQQQINLLTNEISSVENNLMNLTLTVNNMQTALNNKVAIVSPLSGYNLLQVGGTLSGYLSVYKIQFIDQDNPQFYVFNWYGLNGPAYSNTNYVPWPFNAMPSQYTPSLNITYTTSGSLYASPYTRSQQLGLYQMQFPSGQGNYFYLHLDQILSEDSPEAKRLGLKYKPPNPDEDIPGLPKGWQRKRYEEILEQQKKEKEEEEKLKTDKIVKEFELDKIKIKKPLDVQLDKVCFWQMAFY